jgi:hypothetical protein
VAWLRTKILSLSSLTFLSCLYFPFYTLDFLFVIFTTTLPQHYFTTTSTSPSAGSYSPAGSTRSTRQPERYRPLRMRHRSKMVRCVLCFCCCVEDLLIIHSFIEQPSRPSHTMPSHPLLPHPSSHPSFISPILHLTHPSSHPSFISPILHPTHPSSHPSFISPIPHLTHPSSHPSFISPIPHLTHPSSHPSLIPPIHILGSPPTTSPLVCKPSIPWQHGTAGGGTF